MKKKTNMKDDLKVEIQKKKMNWLNMFNLDNMVSMFSVSFIAAIVFIFAHDWVLGVYGDRSMVSGIAFTLVLAALLLNTIASLYLVWHGLVRLVKK